MRADRHRRAQHADLNRRRRPVSGWRVLSAERVRRLAQTMTDALGGQMGEAVHGARIVVADLSATTVLTQDQGGTVDGQPGVVLEAAAPPHPATLTIYRRPIEMRAGDRESFAELLFVLICAEIAHVLGIDPDEVTFD